MTAGDGKNSVPRGTERRFDLLEKVSEKSLHGKVGRVSSCPLQRHPGVQEKEYYYWILGKDPFWKKPSWSVIGDVLHWTE